MTRHHKPEKTRVLVIDDDDIARLMLCDTVERSGYLVRDLASPIGATRVIADENIDAVVLDVVMPSIDGDKLARLLRDSPRGKGLAIVLVSSRPLEDLQRLATRAKADDVVPKAVAQTTLVSVLEKALRKRMPIKASIARTLSR